MTIAKLSYTVVFFMLGLGVGVLWSPPGGSSKLPTVSQETANGSALSNLQTEEHLTKIRKQFGAETEDFVRQFKDMTIEIKKPPLHAFASQDGRYLIHLLGNNEPIASELRQIGPKGVKVIDRHYDFFCGDLAYHCDFARSIEGATMHDISFDVEIKGKTKFVYLDSDGDGLWDRFTDFTQEPPKTYVREGVGWNWKEKTKDSPKAK